MIKIKIKKLVIKMNKLLKMYLIRNKVDFKYSFSLPLILSYLNIDINNTDNNFIHFSYGIFLLSLIALICLINILGYSLAYYFIQNNQSKYEVKYPRLSKFINRYKNFTLIFFIIEFVLCFICLLLLIIFSLLFIYSGLS
uniref:Hyp9 n=1 Tax=Moniliophthora roreri (strain MCA 2997) TaxID=1381753 RepID=F2WVK0_MONRO|nr:hyp9 [Moniliophthora roreri]ADO51592.1 hyp9 [Moniliophthora roreri]